MQDGQSLPSSTPASSSRDPLEHEGKVEVVSCTSAAASTAGSATSDGPEHLETGHWRFEAPNLILDTEAGKVLIHIVPDPDISWCICSPNCQCQVYHPHLWTIITPRAHLFSPSASASVICFCICHLHLSPASASVICFCICHLLLHRHLPSPSALAICPLSLHG